MERNRKITGPHCYCTSTPQDGKMVQAVENQLETLCKMGNEIRYQKGQAIFYEGHYPCGLYLLQLGRVSFVHNNLWGKTENLPRPEEMIFGLFHLVTNTPHCVTALAETDVVMQFIPKSAVLELLKDWRKK